MEQPVVRDGIILFSALKGGDVLSELKRKGAQILQMERPGAEKHRVVRFSLYWQ
jgi:hypothetical protein